MGAHDEQQSERASHSANHWVASYSAARGGRHPGDLDKALPNVHTRALSDHLHRSKAKAKAKATVLAQMQTGKCQLNPYPNGIGDPDPELYEWGQKAKRNGEACLAGLQKIESKEARVTAKKEGRRKRKDNEGRNHDCS